MKQTQKHEIMYIISFRLWQYITCWLYPLWHILQRFFKFFEGKSKDLLPPPTAAVPVKTDTDVYVEKALHSFLAAFEKKDTINWNENIQPVLYHRERASKIMEDPNNELEKSWRRRILMESTPRGNIIMYFDVFHTAFFYFSDQQMVPYAILNAAAMKYVTRFRCLDFFHDSSVKADHVSKLMAAIEAYDVTCAEETKEEKPKLNMAWKKDAPFLKPKPPAPKKEDHKDKDKSKDAPLPSVVAKKTVNRFKHQGKLANFSVLQTPRKLNPINGFEPGSQMKKMAAEHSDFKTKKMSYKDYKQALTGGAKN